MAQVFTCSINLGKVSKEHIFITEDGKKYLNLRLIFNKETPDQYNSVGFVAQVMPKEAQEGNSNILGNIRVKPAPSTEDIDALF